MCDASDVGDVGEYMFAHKGEQGLQEGVGLSGMLFRAAMKNFLAKRNFGRKKMFFAKKMFIPAFVKILPKNHRAQQWETVAFLIFPEKSTRQN